MRSAILACILLCTSLCVAAGRDESGLANPQPIPEVKSLHALRRLPPVHGVRGWVLRLALADSGPLGGPWKLLLCHAKYTGPGARAPDLYPPSGRPGGAEDLGPICFTVHEHGKKHLQEMIKRAFAQRRLSNDSERLYVAPIPTAWVGSYVVRIWSEKSEVIQERRFTVKAPRPCLWMPLAVRKPAKTKEDLQAAAFVVPAEVWAAHPKYLRLYEIWRVTRGTKIKLLAPGKDAAGFLPGRLPPGPTYERRYYGPARAAGKGLPPYPLKLVLRGDMLVVQSQIPLFDGADERLLGRWWVNGKPVRPPVTRQELQLLEKRAERLQARAEKQLRVLLRLGAYLGTLKAGDKVSVQALYCPGGTKRIHRSRNTLMQLLEKLARLVDDGRQPILSDKITFAVTAGMLKQRLADGLAPAAK